MGNRRFHRIEYFQTLDTPESERLKVTALNLFHPTPLPSSKKSVFSYYDTVFRRGRRNLLQGGLYLRCYLEASWIASIIFRGETQSPRNKFLSPSFKFLKERILRFCPECQDHSFSRNLVLSHLPLDGDRFWTDLHQLGLAFHLDCRLLQFLLRRARSVVLHPGRSLQAFQ